MEKNHTLLMNRSEGTQTPCQDEISPLPSVPVWDPPTAHMASTQKPQTCTLTSYRTSHTAQSIPSSLKDHVPSALTVPFQASGAPSSLSLHHPLGFFSSCCDKIPRGKQLRKKKLFRLTSPGYNPPQRGCHGNWNCHVES